MPRATKKPPAASKNGSLKQTSLMSFVKPVIAAAQPSTSAQTRPNDPEFIPGTPEATDTRSVGRASALKTPRVFRSSTGDLVAAPAILPPPPPQNQHQKQRRSSLVTQRHTHVMARRAMEGKIDPVYARQGEYDGLNYAPIHQSHPSTVASTFASQRARRMAQLAAIPTEPKGGQVKRPPEEEGNSILLENLTSGVVLETPHHPKRTLKARRTLVLSQEEKTHLEEVLKELADNRPHEKEEVVEKAQETKGEIVIGESFLEDLKEEWMQDFDERVVSEIGKHEVTPRPWYRYRVTDVSLKGSSLMVSAVNLGKEQKAVTVQLSGSWSDTPLQSGDIFNLVDPTQSASADFTFSDTDESLFNSTSLPLFVLHPDVLISGTTVATAAAGGCPRRAILQHFWAESEESDPSPSTEANGMSAPLPTYGPHVMLVGSVVHEVFQQVVQRRVAGDESASSKVLVQPRLLASSTVLQLYALGCSVEKFCDSLKSLLPKVDHWASEHCSGSSCPVPKMPTLKEVLDVEENIWCTKIGVKGKIDMTVRCQVDAGSEPGLVPLELKTGKASHSFEHQGQVLLYLLMLSDRHSDRLPVSDVAKVGWLVYLRETDQSGCLGLIKPQPASFRGLIQTRNHLAAALRRLIDEESLQTGVKVGEAQWNPKLPSPIDRERSCSWCPHLLTCGLFRDYGTSESSAIAPEVRQLFTRRMQHVRGEHKAFLQHWTRLQLLEYASSGRVEKTLAKIAEGDVEHDGLMNDGGVVGIRGLVVEKTTRSPNASSREFLICLRKSDTTPISCPQKEVFNLFDIRCTKVVMSTTSVRLIQAIDLSHLLGCCCTVSGARDLSIRHGFSVGDFLIVSSDDGRHVGICLASLADVPSTGNTLTISSERPLPAWITHYRLDRYVSDKGVLINLSNLVGLMEDSGICARLRQLIIDQVCPRFTHSLRKSVLLEIRRFLRPLNIHQRKAVLSVLMSKDYTLIKGFPGSGKTETLAALLRCLAVLGKRTLLVSHTHSAVDNVLLRLRSDESVKFVRLGQPDRVNPQVRSHNLESLLSQEVTEVSLKVTIKTVTTACLHLVKFVEETMSKANLIGCTALCAATHEALARCEFDVVVIDEATQLLLPTTLGSLRRMNARSGQFVLLGDDNQLPPLVQSSTARAAGFGKSLFSLLIPVVQHYEDTQSSEEADALGSCLVQLKAQYRMNLRILHLANTLFYADQMECASDEIANRTLKLEQANEGLQWMTRVLSPSLEDSLILLDIQSICCANEPLCRKNVNLQEISVIIKLVTAFTKHGLLPRDIGIVAPYRAQVDALRRCLEETPDFAGKDEGVPGAGVVEVNTADQFQGRDKMLIIVSFVDCLRGNRTVGSDYESANTSILNERPRLNVVLTRAKAKLVLIGCAAEHSRSSGRVTALEEMLAELVRMSAIVSLPAFVPPSPVY